jgi:NAD(P)-dependent dehydrogenase (short-subunit alcohol dehydrogenase family)
MSETSATALVTGAGKRVGAVIAAGLLADGWTVLAHVHHESDAVPDGAVKVVVDLSDPRGADQIFEAARALPPVRLLVNNAARFAFDSIEEFSVEEFDVHMAINARAPMSLTHRFASDHGGGDALIVNILDSKLAAPNPDFVSYTISKQALAGITELSALSLAGKGIRVNAIAPGLMLQSPGQSEANFEAMHSANPLRKGVGPADVLEAIRYFMAAKVVTGQCLVLDGGQRFMRLDRDVQFLGDQ